MGRPVPEFDDLREVIFENYRIVYSFDGEVVTILSVFHASMDVISRLHKRLEDE